MHGPFGKVARACQVEQLLHVGFEMETYKRPPKGASSQQKQAVALGATVLCEEDFDYIMDELRQR